MYFIVLCEVNQASNVGIVIVAWLITETVLIFCKHIDSLKLSDEIISRIQKYNVAVSILS